MQPVLFQETVSGATGAETDTILVELHDVVTTSSVVAAVKTVLMTNDSATAVFSGAITGNTYWIVIKHRNTIQTWSSAPVTFNPINTYDFTSSASQAYGNNMIEIQSGIWAFYNGDINQDENIDLIDFPALDFGINNGLLGYRPTDLNGDGNVDLLDFPILDANINAGIFSNHP